MTGGANSWTGVSSRSVKVDVEPVDPAEVLESLASVPMFTWRMPAESEEVRHMGPMAEDFRDAYGLGASPTGIATVDADGVALAAIQGAILRIRALEEEVGELRRAVEACSHDRDERHGADEGGR
jgi:hypothetical protein